LKEVVLKFLTKKHNLNDLTIADTTTVCRLFKRWNQTKPIILLTASHILTMIYVEI